MSKILVMGPISVETVIKVSELPLPSDKIISNNMGIVTNFSGNGYNVSRALTKLGGKVNFLSVCGNDELKPMINEKLNQEGISTKYIIPSLRATPQSIVLFSDENTRQIINDFKDSQSVVFDEKVFEQAIKDCDCDMVFLCTANYTKPYLKKAKELGKKVITDVHDIHQVEDEEYKEFMQYADILYFSHLNIPQPYEDFMKQTEAKYGNEIIIMGMGEKGAMIYIKKDDFIGFFPSVRTRKIVNTLGAGDSLLSAFVYFYKKTENPYYALKAAILFASYKIGNPSAAHGFLTEEQVEVFYNTIWK